MSNNSTLAHNQNGNNLGSINMIAEEDAEFPIENER